MGIKTLATGYKGKFVRPTGYKYPLGLTPFLIPSSANAATNTTGGTQTIDGTNTVHSFTSSGFFVSGFTGNIEYLAVGGAGAGGRVDSQGGGGGAGGLVYGYNQPIVVDSNTEIVIGAGGAASINPLNIPATPGNNTSISFSPSPVVALKGGKGGAQGGPGTADGGGNGLFGSGGGGAAYNTPFGFGTPGQGNDGGSGSGPADAGGGGGGAGAAGSPGDAGRTGGVGLEYSISGSPIFYSNGGTGSFSNNPGGPAGTANRGNGGGPTGGSGVVIVRYETTQIINSPSYRIE